MDINRFFNSCDVAAHLRETGYEFSMLEAAFIVHLSLDATLDERIAAWREIAETMPDCPMEKRPWLERVPSTKAFLVGFADLKARELEAFCEQDGSVFSLQHEEPGLGWRGDGNIFGSAEACLGYMREHWGTELTAPSRASGWPRRESTSPVANAMTGSTSTVTWRSRASTASRKKVRT